MRITECDKGHFYDADKFTTCPHCEREDKGVEIPAYSGDEPYIFISYAHADSEIVMQFLRTIRQTHRFWYDEGIPSGSEWVSTIAERIQHCTVFLLFVSEAAIASQNVRNEISYAANYVNTILAVHLKQVKLPDDWNFMLGRFQYIDLEKYGFETSIEKMCKSLPPSTKFTEETDKSQEEEKNEETETETEVSESKEEFSELYSVGSVLGKGVMGEVMLVQQRRTGASYIAKHRIFGNENMAVIRAAARNELRNLLRLQGKPYTPELIDFFENENESYLVISKIHGYNLEMIKRERPYGLSFESALSLVYETALILQDMHRMDLVYCDLKPSNIILDQYGRINLVDFDNTSTIYERNSIPMATMKYAAPEQVSRSYTTPDVRFDVYSLGVLMNELLPPVNDIPVIPSVGLKYEESHLRSKIKEISRKMTHSQPRNRYSTMGEVVAVLNLLMDWNPEENLRELALSVIPAEGSDDDVIRTLSSQYETDTDVTRPGALVYPQMPGGGDTTEILSFSPDYKL
ncbi:MAG: TIR domain-containing protein [Lachnospiraceae bacterium]|nr:TIR domain-containing protein [Lachnospiraceae bacterium]